ncbi:MAG: hypothetical protein WC671_01860 [Candidatus Paceibacterota bacterium]|jgi:hypothetical protein
MNFVKENINVDEIIEKSISVGNENLINQCDKKVIYSQSWCVEDINNNSSENESLNYLANILVEAFLDKKEYELSKQCS